MKRVLLSATILTMLLVGCDESELENFGLTIEEVTEEETQEEIAEAVSVSMEHRLYFLTSDEKQYLGTINGIIDIHMETINEIGRLVGDAKKDTSLAKNEKHLKKLESAYVLPKLSWSSLNQMSEDGDVPVFLRESHEALINSIEQLIMTKPYFIEGLVKLDNDIILEGLKHMDESEAYYYIFEEELKEATKVYQ